MFNYSTDAFFSIGGDLRDTLSKSINYNADRYVSNKAKDNDLYYNINENGYKLHNKRSFIEQVDELTK